MRFGFPSHNVREMVLTYPVDMSDKQTTISNSRNMFSYASSFTYIPDFKKISMVF